MNKINFQGYGRKQKKKNMIIIIIMQIKSVKLQITHNYAKYQYINIYGKCSKSSTAFFFLFSNKKLVFRAGIHKMLVRIANREDPDQTASSEAV